MAKIHQMALVSPKAELADDVEVGPFSVIGDHVKIGSGTTVGSNTFIDGYVTIGSDNQILHHVVIGSPPQDLSYQGGESYIDIGDKNIIHEFVTISPGTEPGTRTFIGNGNMLMIGVHAAHNVVIGDEAVIVNYTALGGYVEVGDRAFLSGFVAVHQFCKVGRSSLIASFSKLAQDFPPFMIGHDAPTRVYGLNAIGMRRAGIDPDSRARVKRAYKILYHSKFHFSAAFEQIENDADLWDDLNVRELVEFGKNAERGICPHH